MQSIGGQQGIGGPISPNQIGGESFIRHIGNDKLIFDFHEGSGTTVYDKSRNNNNGTFGAGAAAPTWKRNSLYFDGGDYVDLTGIAHGISTGGFTLCFDVSNYTENTYMFDQETNRFAILNRALHNAISLLDSNGHNMISDAGIDAIQPISCQITRDISQDAECYVNGKSQNKGQSITGDVTYDGISAAKLGSRFNNVTNVTATMYSFRILNKGLSGIECQQIYLSNKWRSNN